MRLPHRGEVRDPVLAGRWYPGQAAALTGAVRGYLAATGSPPGLLAASSIAASPALAAAARTAGRGGDDDDEGVEIRAVIVPHAGYVYSGPTAGVAWRAVANAHRARPFRRVVMVGPAHRVAFRGIAIGDYEAFRVPTGEVAVDRDALATLEREGHATWVPEAHVEEHCLEIEVPFMIEAAKVPVVPLLFGHVSHMAATAALRALVRDDDLLVMSSDLSHYEPYMSARMHDLGTLERIAALDGERLSGDDACGHRGIGAGLALARERGWRAAVLDYRSSGDTAGDKDAVVGYGAVALGCRPAGMDVMAAV